MAKVDLTSNAWCELVFANKNKAYGAYKMRLDSPKRHNWAILIVVVIALIAFCIPTLVRWATPERKEVMTEVTVLSELEAPEVKQKEFKRVEKVAPPPQAVRSSIKFTAPVIKKDAEVHEDEEIKSQEELIDHVWDNSVDGFSNSIRVHISALRKKLRAAMGYDPIHNRIGEGYLLGGPEE